MRVTWAPRARDDLEDILRYIAQDDVAAAFRQTRRIESAVENLARHPAMGRGGRKPGWRELVVAATPYVVMCRVLDDGVEITAVVHGARAWPPDGGAA
ncbi:MAG: type II toxin-antitoxin system RelE/ParE family toxin [Phenylobacterium sp.]|uniref:type II toxin-antitoxin system RelE/ParE family toxin n=1 Tax=Phenylobacterium sp. TaxID=1871053 RepID=UPI001A570B06|nr:type II toxin-antitoxin system RelE/ParE family toxin [Phenylobacterium sp.]MBL8553929.1 type II toxin-antitoxin system RelE/ParE family toxin [Phenylobacterium sp.]